MERRLLKNFDWALAGLVISLALLGLLAIASATEFNPDQPSTWGFVTRQLTWMGVGLAVLVAVIVVDYHFLTLWARVLYVVNLLLLAAVRLFGDDALGAQRWLEVGPIEIQPSEIAKIILIITLAVLLSENEGEMKSWRDIIRPVGLILPPMFLVIIQPDLGTSLVFPAILGGMLYVAGFSGVRLAGLGLGGILGAVGAVVGHLRWGLPLPLKDYQLQRLLSFINPGSDPLGAGYHVLQSEIAIGSGRIMGQGLFAGTQSRLDYLPEQHTDFIFAVIGEEWGLIGGLLVLLLYLLIFYRGIKAVAAARDLFGSLLATGVICMLGFHLLINVGMTLGIMPVTGLPLPFVSYGGSSLVTNLIAIGLVLNVRMRRHKILF